jgi:3-deoxy-D-manno-octulosonate 8-phosphate phosphatase (KDO 8-P phosphatase)
MEVTQLAKRVKLLLMDCDGVLTDGRIYLSNSGEPMKVFNVRDGQGLALWHEAGFASGILSSRGAGDIVKRRADELGVRFVRTKSVDKEHDIVDFADELGIRLDEVAYVGDDLGDLRAMSMVGMPIAVNDAVSVVKAIAVFKTKKKGGQGAIREVVEMLLKAKFR